MSEYFFAPQAPASVAVAGSHRRFAVHRIYCVGLNYAEHVRELGSDPHSPPVFFMKPADALVENGGAETFWAARRQLLFSLPDWPTTLQVAGPQPARVFTKETW